MDLGRTPAHRRVRDALTGGENDGAGLALLGAQPGGSPPQDALVAKEKLPAALAVHVDAVAALDKRRFAREAPVCLVTKSTAPKFKFTVKRRSQPSLSPGGVSVPGA